MACDFVVKVKGKSFSIRKKKFKKKFENFFDNLKKGQGSRTINENKTLNKAIANVFPQLKQYSLSKTDKLNKIFNNSCSSLFDLYLAVKWYDLNNSIIAKYVVETLQNNLTRSNCFDIYVFAKQNQIPELANASLEFTK